MKSKDNEINKCSFITNTNACVSTTKSVNNQELSTSCTQQKHELGQTNLSNKTSDEITLEKLSFKNHAQPYPFTFLTAVKCKLSLDKSKASLDKVYKFAKAENTCEYSMDSVKPLNLPNVKISSKIGQVSEKNESSQEKLLTIKKSDNKYETKSDDINEALTYSDCPSSTVTTTFKNKNFELLEIPNLELSKEKNSFKNSARERDNFKDKENRFKKIKKADINTTKSRNDVQSIGKGSRNYKYSSKKDILDKVSNKIIKNDSILNRGFKDTCNTVKKPAKTNREKSVKTSKLLTTKLCKEVKPNTCWKGQLTLDNDHQSNKLANESNILQQTNDILQNPSAKTALLKDQHNNDSVEYTEIISQDCSNNEKSMKFNEDCIMTSIEKYQKQALTFSTPKENIFNSLHVQQNNVQCDCSTVLTINDNQSSNNSIIETKLSQDSLSEKLMDPLRISFRDNSYSNQPEFNDLVTPDVNLMIRSKRRKQFLQYMNNADDYKDSKFLRKDQNSLQETEVQTMSESNTSDQLVMHTQKQSHFIEDSNHANANSNTTRDKSSDIITESKFTNAENNEKQVKNSSTEGVMNKPNHQADDTVIQTETISHQHEADCRLVFSEQCTGPKETLHFSLDSGGKSEDATKLDDFSFSKQMRTLSEISLHETTSSIRTETGTEISISLRDVTCSFNKNLDLEMAQLIDDERQRYNKIEMLFKSREKTLNDRTRKLVKLEEQKKVLRDTGQDSRISSVKKKQRALLLKLQQEKEEMNRLKELHEIASQERKLMLQKQRDMFNPDMSTKNILHKLKRSADSQSPRRLSGPMKGYDIRSNSSISSLIDSDKSQLDRLKFDCTMNTSDGVLQKENKSNLKLGINKFSNKTSRSVESHDESFSKVEAGKYFEEATMSQMKCDLRSKKFDERMPKSEMKYHLYDLESVLGNGTIDLLKDDAHVSLSRSKDQNFILENVRTKSALIEEFTEIWKSHFSQSKSETSTADEPLATHENLDGALSEKLQSNINSKNTKRKGLKWHKSKPANSLNSSNTKQISVQELIKHSDLLNERNEELLKDIVDERQHFTKQSSEILLSREKERKTTEKEEEKDEDIIEKSDNISVQSHVSLAISHQSSNDSDKSYLKSVVIRSHKDYQPNSSFQTSKKLEQILKAREATLISRRNCVEEWIAWHARLRDEEERVSRMEKAAYKLVSATAGTLSRNDSTISSDNSDVEGRIELLTKKLSDRRLEMTRLKKEARKQAKRRLKALEANLLNQIKKYDETISEMRKKLETKKGPNKEDSKLEIVSKSVDDYKVPDIPIKKIRETYRRSDLLCSQSDSDATPINKNSNDRNESNDAEVVSSKLENSHSGKIKRTKDTNLLEEDCNSATSNANLSKSRSQTDIQKCRKSGIHTIDCNLSQGSNTSQEIASKISSNQLEQDINDNSVTNDKLTHDSNEGSPFILSNKLSYIQLHNKELNDDIHNLENDLRELSEMMLNFSKKSSDQYSISIDSPRNISKAVDELHSKETLEQCEKSKINVENNAIDIDLQMRVKETLSNGVSDTDNISTSIEELYSAIKSENDRVDQHSNIPENFRKSVGTDKFPTISQSLQVMKTNDYKSDTCSIVEIISTTVEKDDEESTINEINHQHLSPKLQSRAGDSQLKVTDDDNHISIRSTNIVREKQSKLIDNDHENDTMNIIQTASKHDTNQFGSRCERKDIQLQKDRYPVVNKTDVLPIASVIAADSDNILTELDSFYDKSDNDDKFPKFYERQIQEVKFAEDYDQNIMSDVEDSTIFVPKGESTNLHETFVMKLDNSSDIGMGICSEEFNDILEIIERETKNDDWPESSREVINLLTEMNEADICTSAVHNNVYIEKRFDEANEEYDQSKKSKVESEKIFSNTNRNSESLANHVMANKNDQCGSTVMQRHSFSKLNEVPEHAAVHEKGDDSSEGEQKNNLIEVVENKLEVLQKPITPKENEIHKTHVTVFLDKTLQVIKDPEYEDISEESLEVSDIFNNTNKGFPKKSKIITTIPEKYVIKSESNEVLRILDEISNKSNKFDRNQQEISHDDTKESPICTNINAGCSSNNNVSSLLVKQSSLSKKNDSYEKISEEILDNLANEIAPKKSKIIEEDSKQNLYITSEKFTSSNDNTRCESFDLSVNPILEIKKDAISDINPIPINNGTLLLNEKAKDATTEFRTTAMGVSTENDIETMIKKLKASMEQPGLEVAELEAKLLEIENLQIELKIKKLEAEEVSYYARNIPNKPPPPYTPPGSLRESDSNGVSYSFSVIPTNIEELTCITEKATAIIHIKKESGEDIQMLKAPDEIHENVKNLSSSTAKKNRKIYNTFLFDLCKELIVDIYKVEKENPGPSWTKPKVKTKRVIKIPKSVNELNEYVSKEVATLFGFKTKLQRENMVMRWSRKRRDRVDELLANEALAEEKEWTKFHHDELTVKNELTVTILNNLLIETTNCVKNAYAKKRKLNIL
ncbi:centrosome-associated protein 350-like [Phymastichus coffea]|uniref:centrosome-associated protein 350-like n=1 Tax=Phymastichus coffea TaxID=108790 RepID=UPI00273A7F89|nr:centrosome-associated protein 350-like [Phymastichus coffea]